MFKRAKQSLTYRPLNRPACNLKHKPRPNYGAVNYIHIPSSLIPNFQSIPSWSYRLFLTAWTIWTLFLICHISTNSFSSASALDSEHRPGAQASPRTFISDLASDLRPSATAFDFDLPFPETSSYASHSSAYSS